MLSITKNKTKKAGSQKREETTPLRQPVLVYSSRVDSLLNEIKVTSEIQNAFNLNHEWMLFIDDLNTKMFDKISF
tara:strand:- start:567 stop:791 length:225 start_codon:yes stop_codon:yes gene_type:complete